MTPATKELLYDFATALLIAAGLFAAICKALDVL